MLKLIAMSFALQCPHFEPVNKTGEPWTEYDKTLYAEYERKCQKKNKCLSEFTKIRRADGGDHYNIWCGVRK